ncbi:peroxidase-like, partial [Frankliniella occidentalis]
MQRGTAVHGQFIESMPEAAALEQGREALAAVKAALYLSQHHCQKYGVDEHKCARWLSSQKLFGTTLGAACSAARAPAGGYCSGQDKYRSLDGSCNHLEQPAWAQGQALTAYRRLLFPEYQDGIHLPRGPKKGLALPSARLVSVAIAKDRDVPDRELTLALMQWTQFVEHDMAHTPTSKMVNTGTALTCCRPDATPLAPRHAHPLCQPVTIPQDDPFYGRVRARCMSYIRSLHAFRPDCGFGPAEQMNQATHFLDGSQLYGTSARRDRSLRLFSGGRLLLARRSGHGQGASRPLLPPADEPRDRCQVSSASAVCYKSGDVRANSHPHLAAMHTLWAREHNRLAEELAELNPQWDDETIFQEARRIVIAEMQHITYDQWLPAILGSRFVQKVGLNTPDSNWYRENMDPSVSNAFATVGLRFGLSMMQGRIQLFDEERRPNASLLLRDHFNKPNVLEDGSSLDGLVRGLATQSSQQVDTFLVEDLTNMMYLDASERGVDALSLAIQRGRDHGLPSYNQYRKLCGLPQAKAFVDFADVMSRQTASRLGGVYAHPDDVDVLVGGMAERPWEGALVGPTLRCVISEQLLRSRRADRYFFDNPDQ